MRNIFGFLIYPYNTPWHQALFGVGKKLYENDFVLDMDKSTLRFHIEVNGLIVVTYKEYTFIVEYRQGKSILASDVPPFKERGKYIDCGNILTYSDSMTDEAFNWYTSKYNNNVLDEYQRYTVNSTQSNIVNPRAVGHSQPTRSRNTMDYII